MLARYIAWRIARRLPRFLPGGWMVAFLMSGPVRNVLVRLYRRRQARRRLRMA